MIWGGWGGLLLFIGGGGGGGCSVGEEYIFKIKEVTLRPVQGS